MLLVGGILAGGFTTTVNMFSEGRGLNCMISAEVLDTVLGVVSWTGKFLVSATGKLTPFVVGFGGWV